MKTTRILLLFIIQMNIVYGQTFESLFGSESTQWNMTIGNLWGSGFTEHHLIGDTIIDDLSYKIINGYDGLDEIQGYIRQDSTNQKAWYRNNISDEEHLIMDLSLTIDDSLYIQGAWNSDHKFYEVDSIYMKDNRKHIQFNFPIHFMDNKKFTLIEGVVSNMGFRYQDNDFFNDIPTILLCAFKNERKIYGDGECVISSFDETHRISGINVYPNPAGDECIIKLNEQIDVGSIEIINQAGEIRYKKSGVILSTELINLQGMNSGVYFVRVFDFKNGLYQTNVLLKSY